MHPTTQRLDGNDLIRLDFDLRLIVQLKLVVLQSIAQICNHCQVTQRRMIARRLIEHNSLLQLFRTVHSGVRSTEHVSYIITVFGINRDTYTGTDGYRRVIDDEWPFKRFQESVRPFDDRPPVTIRQNYRKLISTQAREGIVRMDILLQQQGNLFQQVVALVVPQSIIDILETIQIDQQ